MKKWLLRELTLKHSGGGNVCSRTAAAGGGGNTPPGIGCAPVAETYII